MGSIIGVGIFCLPYSLASYGPISLVAMGLATVGAVALALMFAVMSRRLPADGGPYAYARSAFGNGLGFSNAWSYWITAWAGNAAIVVGWVYYVENFLNKGSVVGWSIAIALVGLWIPAVDQPDRGPQHGRVPGVDHRAEVHPAWRSCRPSGCSSSQSGNFTPWNTSGDSNLSAIGGAMAICLFSYLGVETAAVAAAKVRDPDRNVPKSTIYGTLASAAVYLLSMIAVFGILPTDQLALDANKASYSAAANSIVGGGSWAGNLVALAVIVSGIGALNGWTMICAEMPLAAAKDGLFPKRFGQPVEPERAGLRHHRLDRARLGGRRHQLHGRQRCHGLHHPGADDRDHRGGPLRLLRAGPAEVAHPRPPDGRHPTVRARRLRGRCRVRLLAGLHLLLAQHRRHLVRRLGTVPDGRRRRRSSASRSTSRSASG